MAQFSLLTRLDAAQPKLLERLLAALVAQTLTTWEWVLVPVGPADLAQAQDLASREARIRVVSRPQPELLAWSAQALLPTLGTWLGFVGQHDVLLPTALEAMATALADQPSAKVAFSDECMLGTWNQISLTFAKAGLNPDRLRAQEYLRDLVLIRVAWLQGAGGFDRLASDWPTHDLYLRLLEAAGPAGFVHVPEVLYQRHRNRLDPVSDDPRRGPGRVGYDLYAIGQHYARQRIPAVVTQQVGVVQQRFRWPNPTAVTLVQVVGDDLVEGQVRLQLLQAFPRPPGAIVQILHAGTDVAADLRYRELCRALGYQFVPGTEPRVYTLDAAVRSATTDWVLLLQGRLIGADLRRWLEWAQLPGIGAVGIAAVDPTQLTAPGTLGWRYAGEHWNSAGRFRELLVPHTCSALSPAGLLLDRRRFVALGGFNPAYPGLYGMDYTLRLSASGARCVYLPGYLVQTDPLPVTLAETQALQAAWPGWIDPYGLHQLL